MTDNNELNQKVTSYVGELEVIASGIAPSILESKLKLVYDDLQFEFDFVNNKEINNHNIELKIVEKKLVFILTNFNNSLGTGIVTPLEIGHHNGRRLYISFWVLTPSASEELRVINWTMLKGGSVNNLIETKDE